MLIYTCLASRIEARRAETPLGGSGRSPKAWPCRLAGDARTFLLVAFARRWVTLGAVDHPDRPWEESGMSKRNVLYDPNALSKHRRHAAERDRLGEQLSSCKSSGTGRRLRSRTKAAYDAHHRASLETFRTRYATVQEYARWRFEHWAGDGEVPAVDFEALGSVEEVDRLYLRLQAEVRMFRMSALPVGQPPRMTAFSGGDVQFWRHFGREEMLTGSCHASKGARVLVTVSGRDGLWHVCFMQDWTHVGVDVSEVFQDLANSFYRHALMQAAVQADLQRAMWSGVRGWLGRLTPRRLRGAALRPGLFRFYEHRPPRWLAGEEFGEVRMRFRHGRFGSPVWERHEVIPAPLAAVRRAASRDAKAGLTDVMPDLPQAGCAGLPPGRLPPNPPRTGEQASRGVARRVPRSMAEPGLIAGAALVGALIGGHFHLGYGDHPMLGTAGAMAGLATSAGLIRFVSRSSRAGTKVLGGVTARVAVALLCLGVEIYGFSYVCVCDDVSQVVYSPTITFE